MRACFPAVSVAGKILSLPAAGSFPAGRAIASHPSAGFQIDSRPKARSVFSPESIFFPCFPVRQGKTARRVGGLFDRHTLREVAGLVDVGAFEDGGVVGEELDR